MADTSIITLDGILTPDKRCPFELSDTSICGSLNIFARGYCEKHYRSLSRAGAFLADTKTLTPSSAVARNASKLRKAQRKLIRLMPDYVDLHHEASKIAAKKGESKPIEWALLHTRTVEPVANATNGSVSNTSPTTINIGVKVSGTSSDTDKR